MRSEVVTDGVDDERPDELREPLNKDPQGKSRPHATLLSVVFAIVLPVAAAALWLLIPLREDFLTTECDKAEQSPRLELVFFACYAFVAIETKWTTMFALPRVPRALRLLSSVVGAVILGVVYFALLKANVGGALAVKAGVVLVGTISTPAIVQLAFLRRLGSSPKSPSSLRSPQPSMSLMQGFGWSLALILVVAVYFGWSSLILGVLKQNNSWLSPFFLPVCFVTGLFFVRLLGKAVTARLATFIREQGTVGLDVDDTTPNLVLEIMHQHFFFVFYRQLFFNVNDVMYMAILQMNALCVDLVSALSIFRFSSITREESQVLFAMDIDHLHRQGFQLVIRQMVRVTSFLTVTALSAIVHFGYNHCFFASELAGRTTRSFSRLEANYALMMAWEAVFVIVLSRAVKLFLGVDVVVYAKALLSKRWFLAVFLPASTHFITDVFFGLHNSSSR